MILWSEVSEEFYGVLSKLAARKAIHAEAVLSAVVTSPGASPTSSQRLPSISDQ